MKFVALAALAATVSAECPKADYEFWSDADCTTPFDAAGYEEEVAEFEAQLEEELNNQLAAYQTCTEGALLECSETEICVKAWGNADCTGELVYNECESLTDSTCDDMGEGVYMSISAAW